MRARACWGTTQHVVGAPRPTHRTGIVWWASSGGHHPCRIKFGYRIGGPALGAAHTSGVGSSHSDSALDLPSGLVHVSMIFTATRPPCEKEKKGGEHPKEEVSGDLPAQHCGHWTPRGGGGQQGSHSPPRWAVPSATTQLDAPQLNEAPAIHALAWPDAAAATAPGQHSARHSAAQHARCTCQMPRYARPMEPATQAWMRGRACTLFGRRFRGQPASCGGAAREPAALCGMAACQARPRHIPAPAHRGRSAPPVALPDAPRGGPPGSRQQGQPSPADAQRRTHICSNLKGARGAGMRCTGTPGQRHTGREVVGVCGTCDGRWSNRSLRHKLCYFLAARWP